jgi:hypothetical protein
VRGGGEEAERSPRAAVAVATSGRDPPPAPAGFSSSSYSPAREKKGWDFWGGRTRRRARGGFVWFGDGAGTAAA